MAGSSEGGAGKLLSNGTFAHLVKDEVRLVPRTSLPVGVAFSILPVAHMLEKIQQ